MMGIINKASSTCEPSRAILSCCSELHAAPAKREQGELKAE
jgi:hypothetical protein